jgi:alkylation response protein AidB-like acyl-CoA dehydrogenase
MHFDLSDEQKQFSDNVARLMATTVNLTTMAKGPDAIATTRAALEPRLAQLGVPSVLVSEADGGLEMGLLTLCVLADQFGSHAAPTRTLNNAIAAWLVAEAGDKALRERWLGPLLAGEATAAFALSEGEGAWSPSDWRSTGDQHVRKVDVEGAEGAHLVIAGLADGLVALNATDILVVASDQAPLDMTRPLAAVVFDPGVGSQLEEGFAERLYDALLILAAADAAGAGRRTYEMAVEYAKGREQFGRPIGSFQGLKHQLANMSVEIEPTRFLAWYAAYAWDQVPQAAPRAAALAKFHNSDVAVKTARAAVEAHGGIGYTWEYPLHLLLKRAMYDRMVLGGSLALRRRVASLTPTMSPRAPSNRRVLAEAGNRETTV